MNALLGGDGRLLLFSQHMYQEEGDGWWVGSLQWADLKREFLTCVFEDDQNQEPEAI